MKTKQVPVKRYKLGKIAGRKSFMLGDKPLVKKVPKGTISGQGTVKVAIFQDGKGGTKIHIPKNSKIKMTKGRFMANKKTMTKLLKDVKSPR